MTRCPNRMAAVWPVAALLLAGCSGGAQTQPTAPARQNAPRPSAASTSSNEQAALAAYRGMWADVIQAALTPDAEAPHLADHASDGALRLLQFGLERQRQEGVVTKGQPLFDPQVVSAQPAGQPTKYTLRDCVDDTHWLQYLKSGALKNDVPGGHRLNDATVELKNGVWKVTHLYVHQIGTC